MSERGKNIGATLFVRCLENEGVEYIFGIPGEENIAIMDALLDSSIRFVTTRHEQGAAFMADVYGRLTGKPGVCLSTLGPGATNLVTGIADANMDFAPVVAISGQGSTRRLHKESHQVLDLVNLFEPITRYSTQILEVENIPEVVRKAFKSAEIEKPSASFIELPENIADEFVSYKEPIAVRSPSNPVPSEVSLAEAAQLIGRAKFPIIMAGNGVIRSRAADSLVAFADHLNIPVATTFMAKGAIAASHRCCLGTIGLQAKDFISFGFSRADLVICVGYDMIEYHPNLWHQDKKSKIVHIDATPAEVDEYYVVDAEVIGDIAAALDVIKARVGSKEDLGMSSFRKTMHGIIEEYANDDSFPIKPQKIVWDLGQVLEPEDIVISDVGAHKMWMARMYQAERPNTCIISNGFASMGIALPGAIAAKLVHPERGVVAVTGDAGFLMNSQELETAIRLNTPIVILVWNDSEYGLIRWHQLKRYGRVSHVRFANPDFVRYIESFGGKGYRLNRCDELVPTLRNAMSDDTVSLIDCPVDYSENMKLTEKLGALIGAM